MLLRQLQSHQGPGFLPFFCFPILNEPPHCPRWQLKVELSYLHSKKQRRGRWKDKQGMPPIGATLLQDIFQMSCSTLPLYLIDQLLATRLCLTTKKARKYSILAGYIAAPNKNWGPSTKEDKESETWEPITRPFEMVPAKNYVGQDQVGTNGGADI